MSGEMAEYYNNVDEEEEEEEWSGDYESGPFCRHWGDPTDCEDPCVCGHKCHKHDNDPSYCRECDCEEFKDDEEE